MKRILGQAFSWVLLAIVVLGGLALIVVPKATGAKPLTVLSGSMVPTYDPGDVVVVRPVATGQVTVGDVITFQPVSDNPRLTTHRVVGVTLGSEGRKYVTQGDANGAADLAPVSPKQVLGEVWYAVPLVGYVSVWLAGGHVRTVLDAVAVGLLLYGGLYLALGLRDRRHPPVVPRHRRERTWQRQRLPA